MGMLVDAVSTQFHVSHIHLPRSIIRPCVKPLFACMHPHIIQLASYKGCFAFIIVSKYFRIILFEMGKDQSSGYVHFSSAPAAGRDTTCNSNIPNWWVFVNQHESCKGVVHALSCSSLFPGQSVWWCISQSSMEYLLLQSATGSLQTVWCLPQMVGCMHK